MTETVSIPAQRSVPPAGWRLDGGARVTGTVRRLRRSVKRRIVELLDPVARPVVTTLQQRRGGLDPEAILAGYREGSFPMAGRWGRVDWHNPEERAVIPIDEGRRVPKNVARLIRQQKFGFSFDAAFDEVLHQCATVDGRQTAAHQWLSPVVMEAFRCLHREGHAHSIEIWRDGRLVGGEFGVAVGGFYSGESMFHHEPNAGKVALAHMAEHLQERGFTVFDTQYLSPVAEQFGAYTLPREEYQRRVRAAVAADVSF